MYSLTQIALPDITLFGVYRSTCDEGIRHNEAPSTPGRPCAAWPARPRLRAQQVQQRGGFERPGAGQAGGFARPRSQRRMHRHQLHHPVDEGPQFRTHMAVGREGHVHRHGVDAPAVEQRHQLAARRMVVRPCTAAATARPCPPRRPRGRRCRRRPPPHGGPALRCARHRVAGPWAPPCRCARAGSRPCGGAGLPAQPGAAACRRAAGSWVRRTRRSADRPRGARSTTGR